MALSDFRTPAHVWGDPHFREAPWSELFGEDLVFDGKERRHIILQNEPNMKRNLSCSLWLQNGANVPSFFSAVGVEPSKGLIEFARDDRLHCHGDTLGLQGVWHDGGRLSVWLRYGVILGSCLLRTFARENLPLELAEHLKRVSGV